MQKSLKHPLNKEEMISKATCRFLRFSHWGHAQKQDLRGFVHA